MADALIIIPTYNEAENVGPISAAVLEALPGAHVLIVDDASPDGTGALADELATADDRVHVLHRQGKEGLGKAYLAGFRWALARDYPFVFEMDADFSHQPRYLAPMLAAGRAGADVVIGSRYVAGGGTENWGLGRQLISRGGGLYSRAVLGIPIRDLTGGFKCFRREALEAVNLDRVFSAGFGFQIEMNYRCSILGLKVEELPIVFPDRTQGESKMSGSIFAEALVNVWKLRFNPDIRALKREMRARS